MDQGTCAKLIRDWCEIRGIKLDAEILATWLYAGGEQIITPFDISVDDTSRPKDEQAL